MDLSAFLGEFRAEADEHLAALDAQLLRMEREAEVAESIRTMFLSAHTIKGGAGVSAFPTLPTCPRAGRILLAHYRDTSIATGAANC